MLDVVRGSTDQVRNWGIVWRLGTEKNKDELRTWARQKLLTARGACHKFQTQRMGSLQTLIQVSFSACPIIGLKKHCLFI